MWKNLYDYRKAIAFLVVAFFSFITILLFPAHVGNDLATVITIAVMVITYLSISQLFGESHSIVGPVLWSIAMVFGPLGSFGFIPMGLYWYLYRFRKRPETSGPETAPSEDEEETVSLDDLINSNVEDALYAGDKKKLKVLAKLINARAKAATTKQAATPEKKAQKATITRHARLPFPFIGIPIPFFTYTISSYGIRKNFKFGSHGRDPESWSNIKNFDLTGTFLSRLMGCSKFCFQSTKIGEKEYRVWRFVPNEIADLIESYHDK